MNRATLFLAAALLGVAAPGLAQEFHHDEHLTYVEEEPCTVCHLPEARTIAPATAVCLGCHEEEFVAEVRIPGTATHGPLWAFEHRAAAKGTTYDCSACHRQDDCLECHKAGFADEQGAFGNALANVHRSDFNVTHPIAARTDPQLCSSCHEPAFCIDCHDEFSRADLAFRSHRRGFSDLLVSPAGPAHEGFDETTCQNCHPGSVLPTHEWSSGHAREARKNLATCQACHPEGDVCLTCHSARVGLRVNPHPEGWDDMKGRLRRASDGKTCRKCH
ncbi:MAG: cytochrome c [Deferrisomatales bacterium]